MHPSYDKERRLQVSDFLKDFKENIGQGRTYFYPHLKNLETLAELGLTYRNREDILLALTVEDYSAGPTMDTYYAGQVYWVFGKQLEDVELYIKIKLVSQAEGEYAVCISFHTSEVPLGYPFRT